MALKTFILYFAPFLAGSMMIFAIIKQFASSFAAKANKPIRYGGVFSVISSGLAFLATFISENPFLVFWILAAVYLIFGWVHILLTHRKYFSNPRETKQRLLTGEVLFSLSIIFFSVAAFAALQYFLKDKSFMFYPMLLSMLFFFIPLLLYHTFDAAYDIPDPLYATWEYPLNQTIDLPDEKENEQLYVIGFEIAKRSVDAERTYFRAKAPAEMNLGELFYHFINDYNEVQSETPIEYIGKDKGSHTWYFRTRPKWYGFSTILDPFKTVYQNRIKENTVIICERAAI
ncbi:MAG: hypothetical protein H7122_16375 [Chitinophagaceae bacterium]|nr:hypothetical protein [Chitinophagaceae bacterium]